MSKGVLAIFSQSNAISLNSIHPFVNLYKMPFVSTSHPTYKNYKNLEPYNYEYKHEPVTINPADAAKKEDDDDDDDNGSAGEKDANEHYDTENHLSKHLEMINQAHLNTPTIVDDIISPDDGNGNDGGENKSNFQLTIHPDMVPVLVSLIKYSRWKSIYYIYNHDEGSILLAALHEYICYEFFVVLLFLKH
jgi:hypothetical protein